MKTANLKVCHALWNSASGGYILLAEDWEDDENSPPLFLGPVKRPFRTLERATPEEFGRLSRYYRKGNRWHFVLRPERYPQVDFTKEKVYLAGDFNGWGDAIGQRQWELSGDAGSEGNPKTYCLSLTDRRLGVSEPQRFKFVTASDIWLDIPDSAPNWVRQKDGIGNLELDPKCTGRHVYRFQTPEGFEPLGNEEVIWIDGDTRESVPFPPTERLLEADARTKLGVSIDPGKATTFRLFAPRARAVKVAYGLSSSGEEYQPHYMERVDDVVWEVTIPEDLTGHYYFLFVEGSNSTGTTFFDPDFPILDPYAVATVGHRGPALVLDRAHLPRPEKPFSPPAWHDLVIAEAHVRDLIARAPLELEPDERLGYAGLEKWLRSKDCYLKELGVNAVELQPLQEFDNPRREEYHWGYMPVNYFSPESSYALHPTKGSQIKELQSLVRAFHEQGIAVIVDVVYNHVGEPNHLLFIDKYYYFNLSDDYDLMNWSGCGNDLRCDTPMGRHLIVESLKHWVEVFDVDGFRFDLAELVGADVLETVEFELKKVKPGIILIAEPWSFRGHIQDQLKDSGYTSWSDGFRKFIAEYVCGQGNQEGIQYFIAGSPSSTRFAAQVVNYTESHDDRCWLDGITDQPDHNGSDPSRLDRIRTHLMGAILFASIGVPMLAAGQDFLRTKQGVKNTYQRGDLNALDYNRRFAYSATHAYFSAWIKFRRSSAGQLLRVDGPTPEGYQQFFFCEGMSAVAVLYNARGELGGKQLLFAVNPHFEYAVVPVNDETLSKALQIADHERFVPEGLSGACFRLTDGAVHLPPLSCGLWVINN